MIVSTQIIDRRASSASGAEVGARELIETNAPRLSVQGDASLEQAIDSVGRAGGALDVLLDQDDRGALGPDAPERLVDLIDDEWCEPERDLVAEQELRIRHQGTADRDHVLLASRQLIGPLPPALAQHREELVDARQGPRARPAVERSHHEIFLDVQRGEEQAPLRHRDSPSREMRSAGSLTIGSPAKRIWPRRFSISPTRH